MYLKVSPLIEYQRSPSGYWLLASGFFCSYRTSGTAIGFADGDGKDGEFFFEALGKDGEDGAFGFGMAEEDDADAGGLVGEHFVVLEFAGDQAVVGVLRIVKRKTASSTGDESETANFLFGIADN